MRLFIPPLGTRLVLTEPWKFMLYNEYRNRSLIKFLKLVYPKQTDWGRGYSGMLVSLPAGSRLSVGRIYIKQNQGPFDSVTFNLLGQKGKIRFWAKLHEVNGMECEIADS